MKFLSESEEVMCNFEVDMNDEEAKFFIEYFDEHCTEEQKHNLKINWSIIDILTKQIELQKKEK